MALHRMEILLKRYLWVVNLLVVAICAGYAGRAAGHLAEGAYLAGYDVKAPLRAHAPAAQAKLHAKDGGVIVSRDIFCAGCGSIKPVESETTQVSNEWLKTTLQLELVSTM